MSVDAIHSVRVLLRRPRASTAWNSSAPQCAAVNVVLASLLRPSDHTESTAALHSCSKHWQPVPATRPSAAPTTYRRRRGVQSRPDSLQICSELARRNARLGCVAHPRFPAMHRWAYFPCSVYISRLRLAGINRASRLRSVAREFRIHFWIPFRARRYSCLPIQTMKRRARASPTRKGASLLTLLSIKPHPLPFACI
jgi:hypothetical protein